MGRRSKAGFFCTTTRLMSCLGFAISRAALIALVAASAVTVPRAVAAPGITVEVRDCAEGIHLSVTDARLSEVLEQLSEVLKFRLQFDSSSDPIVNVNMTRQPVELVQALRSEGSKIISQAPDSRCPGRDRVTAVWILPEGKTDASLLPDALKQLSPHQRKIRAMYFQSHGMLPDGSPIQSE